MAWTNAGLKMPANDQHLFSTNKSWHEFGYQKSSKEYSSVINFCEQYLFEVTILTYVMGLEPGAV